MFAKHFFVLLVSFFTIHAVAAPEATPKGSPFSAQAEQIAKVQADMELKMVQAELEMLRGQTAAPTCLYRAKSLNVETYVPVSRIEMVQKSIDNPKVIRIRTKDNSIDSSFLTTEAANVSVALIGRLTALCMR